ncbi:MAG: nucleotidyl transferase AbiEii/AbiGii toxin family protein [Gammaproteobacteria bacterium]|nr:nucleotidyl transferase AbiEii/AbiGii toxin family protein [Gammaproteobacteria bacterium]
MNNWDSRYAERVKLLVEILPTLAEEKHFALKGGTAINLFERDLPRLSVDIDLTWLPVGDFASDVRDISAALEAIGERLRSGPLRLQVQASGTEVAGVHRLIASRNRSRVQIETTPVMRGTVHPVRTMRVRPGVEQNFGFAEIQVLDFADLYAGKLSAALSRQHPRDLFDLQPLLDEGRLDERLWRTFLVYLTCSSKPAAEMLAPQEPRDFAQTFIANFQGMTAEPVTTASLLNVRERLLKRIDELLDAPSRAFLESIEREAPDFSLIGLPHAAELPGVRRKLINLGQRSAVKRATDHEQLTAVLGRISSR